MQNAPMMHTKTTSIEELQQREKELRNFLLDRSDLKPKASKTENLGDSKTILPNERGKQTACLENRSNKTFNRLLNSIIYNRLKSIKETSMEHIQEE